MSTPLFGSKSHTRSDLFTAPKAPSSPHHSHHGLLGEIVHGPTDFLGNLLGDVRDAAVGLPTGMVMLAEHPVRGLENMGKLTWQDWSPLFHGHPGKFLKQTYAHPLAPILDVASLVTGGAGLAARGGEGLAALGAISKESKLAQLSGRVGEKAAAEARAAGDLTAESKLTKFTKVEGAPAVPRHLSENPVVRLRQNALHNLGTKLSEVAPQWFGRTAVLKDGAEDVRLASGSDGIAPSALNKVREIQKGSVRDMSDAGRVERYMKHQHSYRQGALRAMVQAQVAAFVKAGEDITKRPEQVAKAIDEHGHNNLVFHADQVTAQDAKVLKNGLTFVRARPGSLSRVTDLEKFESEMKRFGQRHTTSDINQALRDPETGHYYVVHKHDVRALEEEGVNSSKFLTKLYKYPTATWKYLILATRPAYFVNNAVGNTFMTMATLGPVAFSRGLADAFRQVHGERAAARSLEGASKALREHLPFDFQDEAYLGVHQGFGSEAMAHLKLNERIAGHPRSAAVVRRLEQGFYPVTHKVADVFLRRVMINALMRKDLRVRALMKRGATLEQAAREVSKDPVVRNRIQEMVNNALGDYHHFTPVEKQLRQLVPFYSWDRAIVRHGVHLTLDRTPTAALGANVGSMGTKETERLLGTIPSFLKGALVLPGHGKQGRTRILSTLGLNPYATLPDVTDTVGALAGVGKANPAEAIGSQLNPLITGAIESMTHQSLVSGARLPQHGGVLESIATATGESLPQVKLIETLLGGESKPHPNARTGKVTNFLYRKDARSQIAALMGVPVKELDKARANEMGRAELGIKKGRKRSHKKPAGLF